MHAVIMQKCFIFLRFTKLCSCVELYSPKKLLATSLGDPNCSTISSYLRAAECSDSNSDSRFFKDDSISFFSFPLQHSWIVDQTALDEKTSVLVPCFRYKFTCKGEAEDFFWAKDTIIGSSQKQGEMLVNAVNGSTDSIFGSEFLK